MKKHYLLCNFFLLLFLIFGAALLAQPTAIPIDTTSKLEILPGSGRYTYEKKDSVTTVVSLAARARIKQDKTLIEADSAVINLLTKLVEAFGSVHINDSDTLNTYAQYLKYFGKEKKALLKKNVRLADNKGGVLTTDELEYDLNTKVATYNKGGRVVNKETVLTSKEGIYFGETKDVIFKKEVLLISPEYKVIADSLLYNTSTEVARFIAPTTIINGNKRIYTKEGYYNLKTGDAYFGKRTTFIDSNLTVTADISAIDKKTGITQLQGNVIINDTANGLAVLSQKAFLNKTNGSFLATERPLLILKQNADSLYLTADTLFSGKITDREKVKRIPILIDTSGKNIPIDLLGKDSARNRFFEAFHHVRIFSDSLQAVCDSFFYASTDSVFRLYTNPIVWGNNSQITADTIYLFTKNKKAEKLVAFENGFIINKVGTNFFNQIRGRTINGSFKYGNIDFVRTKGGAECVYFVQDEINKIIGVNKSTSDIIDTYFKENKPDKVKFLVNLKGTTFPIKQVTPDELRLKGFNWQDAKRPKSKFELFGN